MNNTKSKLINSTVVYSIGSLGTKVLTFLLLPIFSYFLTKEDLGIYDVILVSIHLLTPIITFQLSEAAYRWLIESDQSFSVRAKTITNSFFSISILVFIFYLICIPFTFLFKDIGNIYYLLIVLLPSCFFPFFQQIVRGLGQNKLYATVGVLNAFLILTTSLIFLAWFDWGIKGILLALSSSNIISILFIVIKTNFFRYVRKNYFSNIYIKDMIKYSWPLIPNAISWWLINAANKYIIALFMSFEANGIYAISSKFPSIITIFNSIFMLSWQDFMLDNDKKNPKTLSRIFNSFFTIELTVVILLISSSKFLVNLLFESTFHEAWKYMPILFIAAAFSSFSAYYGTYFLKEKKTINIFYTTIIGGITNLLISILFINKIGLYAPALGTLCGFILIFIIRSTIMNQKLSISINTKLFFFLLFIAILFSYLCTIDNIIVNITLIAVSIILFIFLNRSFLTNTFNSLPIKFKKVK